MHLFHLFDIYLYIIYQDDVQRTSIDIMKIKWLGPEKSRSKLYPVETMMNADYADDLKLLRNTSAQDESLLPSLQQDTAT